MPRTGAPPMIPETPTTVLASVAALIPGTARIGPMLTTGLDGGKSTKSASAMASSTPGAGVAPGAPTGVIAAAGTAACRRTHHSWKWTTEESSRVTCVSTVSSVIGSRRTPGRHRSHRVAVTSDSGRPADSSSVRRMWVA
jgi:hypothetical protein